MPNLSFDLFRRSVPIASTDIPWTREKINKENVRLIAERNQKGPQKFAFSTVYQVGMLLYVRQLERL